MIDDISIKIFASCKISGCSCKINASILFEACAKIHAQSEFVKMRITPKRTPKKNINIKVLGSKCKSEKASEDAMMLTNRP